MRNLLILILFTGCASSDYYHSDKYKRKMRIEQSHEMFEETHRVRKKCAPRRNRPRRAHRKRYYS